MFLNFWPTNESTFCRDFQANSTSCKYSSNKKTFPLRTFVLDRKLTGGPALSCKGRLGQVTLWVHHLPPRFCGAKGQYTPLQEPEHSFTKPRSMCTFGTNLIFLSTYVFSWNQLKKNEGSGAKPRKNFVHMLCKSNQLKKEAARQGGVHCVRNFRG